MKKAFAQSEIGQARSAASLHKALDEKYRRLLETAKADWQHLFGGRDPSDSCVTVRISKAEMADELACVPRAGFLLIQSTPSNRKVRRRFA